MSYVGIGIIIFGIFIAGLSIFTRPGTSTKPAGRNDSGEHKDKTL